MPSSRKSPVYAPIVRTRDAELKGFLELDVVSLERILPVFELTRSRRSKKNPDGSLEKTLEKIEEITSNYRFIVDLSSLESQANSEMTKLLAFSNGFSNWRSFVSENFGANCIPVVHYTEPFDGNMFMRQVEGHLIKFRDICIRVPTGSDATLEKILDRISKSKLNKKCHLILDAGYVAPKYLKAAAMAAYRSISLAEKYSLGGYSVASSSFPSSVVAPGYGQDNFGMFKLSEVKLHQVMAARFKNIKWIYSDYCAIHPLDFQGTVTNWVPRVDVPMKTSLYYHRYRRDDGGYVLAAEEALTDSRYDPIECWAHENIVAAAEGDPLGKSPSHWIGVRVNMHATRQARWRS